jgi:1-acyl-sn-glycerol-3-phosphate acyltransferase
MATQRASGHGRYGEPYNAGGKRLLFDLVNRQTDLAISWRSLAKRAVAKIYENHLLDPETVARIDKLAESRTKEFGNDPFGFDAETLKLAMPLVAWLYRHYFRVDTYGLENVPPGKVLLISNHSGQLPMDAMMIVVALLIDADRPRMVRSMVERWVPELPFVSWFFARCGQILGTRDNFRLLTELGSAILVFPEGVVGINKTYDKAYQLQRFGYGFMRLALENNLPIVPIAVVGAEEQAPAIWDVKPLAKLLGIPALPITPLTPFLGPLGLLPMPVKYHIYFGEPIRFDGQPDDEDRVIGDKVDVVKRKIQSMLDQGLEARKGIFI